MINALRYTEELEKVGFTADQAKKSVDIWLKLMDQNFSTKADLREFQLATQSEFRDLRNSMESSFKEIDNRFKEVDYKIDSKGNQLLIQLGSLFVVVMGVGFTVLSFLISKA